MSAWSGLIHQISQGVTNQVVNSISRRIATAITARTVSPKTSGPVEPDTSTPAGRAAARFNEWARRVRERRSKEDGTHPGHPPEHSASSWSDAYTGLLNSPPVDNLGGGGGTSPAAAAKQAEPDATKPQSALSELLASLAAAAKQAVSPISAKWQAVRDTTKSYLTKRRREAKSFDAMDSMGEDSPMAGKLASEYEASKQRTLKARRAWTNAIFGRGDVVNAARQRHSDAKAESKAEPASADKLARAQGTLADLRKAQQLQGGGLGKSMSAGLGTAQQALVKAGGHLGAGFVGRVSGAVTKLAGIGRVIGAGFVAAIPVIGQIIGALALVGAAVGTGIRWAAGRGDYALTTHTDDVRVFSARQARQKEEAHIHRLMSFDTAATTAELQEAGDRKRQKSQPWRAAMSNAMNRTATWIENRQSDTLDLVNEFSDSTAAGRSWKADTLRWMGFGIPGVQGIYDMLASTFDPGFTAEEKEKIKKSPEAAAGILKSKREEAIIEKGQKVSDISRRGLISLSNHFNDKRDRKDANRPRSFIPQLPD